MSHLVITIGCEYGAKGNQIGRKIAEDLGFQFYDRNIVDAIIYEVGIPGEIMEKVEEGVTIVGKGAEGEERGEFSQYADLTKRAIHVQKTIIRKLSDRESCVIIGRSADYILKEHKPILRVFIYSPDEVRIKNVMESHKVSEKEAKQIILETDKRYHKRHMALTGSNRGDRHTFADITYIAILCFITPVRVSNQATSHTDQVSVASCKDIIGNLRIPDISDSDRWLSKFIANGFCHV